jgi:hypothetical protein
MFGDDKGDIKDAGRSGPTVYRNARLAHPIVASAHIGFTCSSCSEVSWYYVSWQHPQRLGDAESIALYYNQLPAFPLHQRDLLDVYHPDFFGPTDVTDAKAEPHFLLFAEHPNHERKALRQFRIALVSQGGRSARKTPPNEMVKHPQ